MVPAQLAIFCRLKELIGAEPSLKIACRCFKPGTPVIPRRDSSAITFDAALSASGFAFNGAEEAQEWRAARQMTNRRD
ncbi:hypothetical protein LZ554_001556 [Drepanopeziza brunnea f. sp. 'monogermtubi']|nr:hypothetical protein LZ554_001556 [Drepanopeziza brunnea f. sp. 'monogermtubi']